MRSATPNHLVMALCWIALGIALIKSGSGAGVDSTQGKVAVDQRRTTDVTPPLRERSSDSVVRPTPST
ncbi:MAG: hypothetical protein QM770_06100 [Tepidisphaeraceae bacterium]